MFAVNGVKQQIGMAYSNFTNQKCDFKLNHRKCLVWEYVLKKLPFENIEKSAFEIAIPNGPLETLVVAPNSDQILDH